MGSGFLSRLGGDGRAERILNRLVSRAVRATPWGLALLGRSVRRLPARPCRVLFVCKGNVCRSAYAELRARSRVSASSGWEFSSAGLEARPGTPPPEDAVSVARQLGLDLSAHRSRSLSAIDPASVEVVFVMEPAQMLRGDLSPFRARSPVLLLGSLAEDPFIADPFGRDHDAFRICFAAIDTALDRLLQPGSGPTAGLTGQPPAAG